MPIEVKFDNLHQEVQKELKKATNSILIAVAWITFSLYKDILKDLINQKVTIKIICTKSPPNTKQIDVINELRAFGVNIRLYEMPQNHNHMHHKFAVIDNLTILNGSFNWSDNAKKSIENLVIIKNEFTLVNSFVEEFEKIERLDKKAIKSLQTIKKCGEKLCGGDIASLLVFQSSPIKKTYEVWGDIVECCSSCGDMNHRTIKSGIQDTHLYTFLNKEELDFNEEDSVLFDREVDSYLTGYSSHGVIIHAIGFVSRELKWRHEEYVFTKIIWKNKFVGNFVKDRYETDFGVFYE